jgi:hypothetical protein
LHGPLRFTLHDHRSWQHLTTVYNVANTKIDEITAAQLAIDCGVEQYQIAVMNRTAGLESNRFVRDVRGLTSA